MSTIESHTSSLEDAIGRIETTLPFSNKAKRFVKAWQREGDLQEGKGLFKRMFIASSGYLEFTHAANLMVKLGMVEDNNPVTALGIIEKASASDERVKISSNLGDISLKTFSKDGTNGYQLIHWALPMP